MTIGTISSILITLIKFGMWRADQNTRSMAKLEALNPILTGGKRLQAPIQR